MKFLLPWSTIDKRQFFYDKVDNFWDSRDNSTVIQTTFLYKIIKKCFMIGILKTGTLKKISEKNYLIF